MADIIKKIDIKGGTVQMPTVKLPTIPVTKQFVPQKTPVQTTAKNPFDWGKLAENGIGLIGQIISLQTAKVNAAAGIQTYDNGTGGSADTGGSGGSGGGGNEGGGVSPIVLGGAALVGLYFLTK